MTSLRSATLRLFERLHDDGAAVDAPFAVAPSSAEEAAEVLTAAAEARMRVAFAGAGTRRGYGNPVIADLVVTSRRMNRVIDFQPEDLTVVVGSGVTVGDLEAVVTERNLSTVLQEQTLDGTVGGAIATGDSGFRRLRYGPTRDRVLETVLATGYGASVRGGGRVVKNVTGYDLPRLVAGSFGSLGMITSVCLKLWPRPIATSTVTVDDPATAFRSTFRPLAVLETNRAGRVYLAGTEEEVAAQQGSLGGEAQRGLLWPEPVSGTVVASLRVPPRLVADAVQWVFDLEAASFVAEHGVGAVTVGIPETDTGVLSEWRSWAEEAGGGLVIRRGSDEVLAGFDRWGREPDSLAIQRSLKAAFDPTGICNPGILPGGI